MVESNKSSSKIKLYCPIEQTWTISEETLNKMIGGVEDEKNSHISELAAMPSLKYNLNLIARNNVFVLYLHLSGNADLTIHGKFSHFIKPANCFWQLDGIFVYEGQSRGGVICNTKEMFDSKRKFIVDGKLTVEMKGILIIEVDEMPKVPHVMNPLGQGLWERDDKDFQVIVGEEGKIMTHKLVLSSRSPVFEAMFRSGMKESINNCVEIPDFTLKTVQLAIDFFYCRDIFQTLTHDDAFELLRFADKYNVNDLQLKLDTYFSYHLSPSTVCQLANGSINSHNEKLGDICLNFLVICLRHAIPVDDIDILDKDLAAELLRKAFAPASD